MKTMTRKELEFFKNAIGELDSYLKGISCGECVSEMTFPYRGRTIEIIDIGDGCVGLFVYKNENNDTVINREAIFKLDNGVLRLIRNKGINRVSYVWLEEAMLEVVGNISRFEKPVHSVKFECGFNNHGYIESWEDGEVSIVMMGL